MERHRSNGPAENILSSVVIGVKSLKKKTHNRISQWKQNRVFDILSILSVFHLKSILNSSTHCLIPSCIDDRFDKFENCWINSSHTCKLHFNNHSYLVSATFRSLQLYLHDFFNDKT